MAACAVVLENVPPHTTVAGIPARPVGATSYAQPSLEMDHKFKEAESTVR